MRIIILALMMVFSINGYTNTEGTSASNKSVVEKSTSNEGVVKKSRSGICHAPGTTYYSRTKNFTPFKTLDECLKSGGRLPKR
jgi:hypothetical protein